MVDFLFNTTRIINYNYHKQFRRKLRLFEQSLGRT